MKKFVKGLLFGSIVGGTVTLLTTKQNGKKNREQLYENIVSLSEDISTLSNEEIPYLNDLLRYFSRKQYVTMYALLKLKVITQNISKC